MDDTGSKSSEIAIPAKADLAVMMRSNNGLDPILSRIESEARSHAPDLTSAKGRKAIASLAYKIAQSKTALDDAGKSLNEEARKQIGIVDVERRRMRDRLDALKDEIRRPLTDWESAEASRIDKHKARLERLTVDIVDHDATSDTIAAALKEIEATAIDETWDEFLEQAAMRKDNALRMLRQRWSSARAREDAEAEAARLRKEKEELEAKLAEERMEREREEAKKRREQEEREAEARRKAEEEHRETERLEAIERARKEEQERAERERKEAEEKAERDRLEAEERHRLELERAEREKQEAIEAERQRQADAEAKERAEREAREKDEAHRAKIYEEINRALIGLPISAVAKAIMDGKVPHVRVVL